MRRLLRFTIGFASACALGTTVLWGSNLTVLWLAALAAGIICLAVQRKREFLQTAALLLLGLGAGLFWCGQYHSIYLSSLEPMDGMTVPLSVTATDYSQKTKYGCSVEVVTVLDGKPYFLTAYPKETTPIAPGTVLEGEFRLRLTTPAGLKDSTYYRGNGQFLVATQKVAEQSHESDWNELLFLPARAKQTAVDHITAAFPDDTAPFAKALLLGDTSDFSYQVDTAFKVSGIRHVVAVSGLHVSALFSVIYFFFRRRRLLTFLIAVPVLTFFAAVTGFSPSVTRATLMALLMALGAVINEEYDGLTGLSFASLIMMLLNPFVIASVSFQLSVSSVAGILLLAPPIFSGIQRRFPKTKPKSQKGRLVYWFAGAVSVSASALLASAPLSAYYFGSVSLIGIFSNLLLLWMIPFLFSGIAAVGLLGGLVPGACSLLARLLSYPLRLLLRAAEALSKIPFAAVYTQSKFIVIWLVCVYVLIAVYLLYRKHFPLFALAGAAALGAAIAASVLVPGLDTLRLEVLDVGEGQAILLQNRRENYLIDCGGYDDGKAADEVAQTLLSQGIFRLDGVILTHYDRDHCGALPNLLTRIDVTHFYLPEQGREKMSQSLADECADRTSWIQVETQYTLPTGILTLLPAKESKSNNENSMGVLFESEECVILVTGDRNRAGEKELIRDYALPDVDVLIAGHHGSKKATSQELLQAVRPEIVIISVGANNSYGHPAPEVLERLAEFGCTVYRTDEQGSVLLRR